MSAEAIEEQQEADEEQDDSDRATVDMSGMSGVDVGPMGGEEPPENPMDAMGGDTPEDVPEMPPLGESYCRLLGLVVAGIISRHGEREVNELEPVADEYATMARYVGLDEHVDYYMAVNGMDNNLPPGQAILMGTGMVLMFAVIKEEGMADSVMQKAQDSMNSEPEAFNEPEDT